MRVGAAEDDGVAVQGHDGAAAAPLVIATQPEEGNTHVTLARARKPIPSRDPQIEQGCLKV